METPFAQLLAIAGIANPVSFFGARVNRTTISNWKAGRRRPPQWAVDQLRQALRQRHSREAAIAEQLTAGPGRHSTAINIQRWRARRA